MALVLASLVASPAQAAPPPSLAGEQFVANSAAVNATCDVGGGTFTITYTASGPATGAYAGTFTETGTITGRLTSGTTTHIQTWNASFTITSAQGQVNGQKTLSSSVDGLCNETFIPISEITTADAQLAYTAAIKTASGTFGDQGQATAHARHDVVCSLSGPECDERNIFTEDFTASTGVLPTNGKATGGGQLLSGANRVTIGFNASKAANGRLQGNCNVVDQTTRTQVKCLTVTDYVQIGNTATWEGVATVNGVQTPYRITVQDNGEPNRGTDTFSITAGTYQASGNVTNGNVQVHKQEDDLVEAATRGGWSESLHPPHRPPAESNRRVLLR